VLFSATLSALPEDFVAQHPLLCRYGCSLVEFPRELMPELAKNGAIAAKHAFFVELGQENLR